MGIISFDSFNLYERPTIVLCRPDLTELYVIGNTVDLKYCPRFNALSELSFTVYEYIDNTKMPYYDYLVNRKLIYVEEFATYFQIVACPEDGDGEKTHKNIRCQSMEVQLATKALGLFKGTYRFWSLVAPNGTLLQEILDLLPGWSAGSIDVTVSAKYRTFDVTNTTVYNFLMTDVEEAYECVFSFDTVNKTISVDAISTATTATDIYMSYDNVIKNISIDEIGDEFITSLTVLGGGELSINQVNPLGNNNIFDFTYLKTTDWMSQSLIDAITDWETEIANYQTSYATYLTALLNANEDLIDLQSDLVTLQGEYDAYEQVKIVRIQQGLSLTSINASLASKQTEIDGKNAEITSKQASITSIELQLAVINNHVSFDSNFTTAQIEELQPHIIQSNYTNENFIQTSTMTNAEIQAQAQELYDQAVSVLSRISEPRYNFSVNSINFPLIYDFLTYTNQLVLGAVINLEIKPDVISYPVLLGFDLNYDNPEDFSLIFGNRLRLDNSSFQYSDLMDAAISSATTTNVNSNTWSTSASYVNNDVTTFMTSALNAATNTVISGTNQNIILNENGLRGRQLISGTTYSPEQWWFVNNMLAFSDDGFATSKLALGKITTPSGGTAYGLVADTIVGRLVASNELVVSNDSNTFTLDANGATLTNATLSVVNNTNTQRIYLDPANGIKIQGNAGGTWTDRFYADSAGNLIFKGTLSGANGTFSGTITATTGTIGGWSISSTGLSDTYGNYISSNGNVKLGNLTISGTTATFSGTIYASKLSGKIIDSQIQSLSFNKLTAVSINADTITSGTINGINIYGGNIYSMNSLYSTDIECMTITARGADITNLYTNYIAALSGGTINIGSALSATSITAATATIPSLSANGGVTASVQVKNWSGTNIYLFFTRGTYIGHS